MKQTHDTTPAHVNACALGTEELVAGFFALTAATSYIQAFFKTLGEESAKSTTQAISRARRRTRHLELAIPVGMTFVVLVWPQDGVTDESLLALLDLDIPIEGGTFRWNPDNRTWEKDQADVANAIR
ncbi:hypothetical protein ABH935_005841 [Catenulispora sp. GAS73]|uniref:hypothetical protein n=1 Tax=Catenulispora sp. GAS73 TaxID=3156269 RepID=UPI0035175DA1